MGQPDGKNFQMGAQRKGQNLPPVCGTFFPQQKYFRDLSGGKLENVTFLRSTSQFNSKTNENITSTSLFRFIRIQKILRTHLHHRYWLSKSDVLKLRLHPLHCTKVSTFNEITTQRRFTIFLWTPKKYNRTL